MNILPMLLCDGYKIGHPFQYPDGIEMVYSNMTARGSRVPGIDKVVMFGLQPFLDEYLVQRFNRDFFYDKKKFVLEWYERRIENYLGPVKLDHIAALHDLGYLPVEIKAIQEGARVPLRVPLLTVKNTHPKFAWVTNFLETILSCQTWQPITSATIAYEYRKILDKYAAETSDMPEFVKFQGHDFSMRGMSSLESACLSGTAHLTSFVGTDTIPALDYAEEHYRARNDFELVGCSVPATEHSVMCMGGPDEEPEMYKRLIQVIYPDGIVSIVCDSYDYWHTLNVTIRGLRDEILARNGKVVIRPDSGDPTKIICGDRYSNNPLESMGTIDLLWDIFGGTTNSKGYKQLDSHIGAIYGDSITLDRCVEICERLKLQGFASTNMVFGVGSFSYQYNTRDTFGLAFKATYAVINGKPREIYKDPKTDSGLKKSAKGLLMVYPEYDEAKRGIGDLKLFEQVTPEQEATGCLQTVFLNGVVTKRHTLSEIRNRLHGKSF